MQPTDWNEWFWVRALLKWESGKFLKWLFSGDTTHVLNEITLHGKDLAIGCSHGFRHFTPKGTKAAERQLF